MIFCESISSRASLSAINLENQGFAKLVHEFVHESPNLGAFFMPFQSDNSEIKKPGANRASSIVPQHELWLSQQCVCKDIAFLENPPYSGKNLFYPIQYRHTFEVKQYRNKQQGNIKSISPSVWVGGWCFLLYAFRFLS